MPMIKSELHLLQVQRKVLSADSMILPKPLFRITPESLNAVDVSVVLPTRSDILHAVVDRQMLPIAFDRLITLEAVRVEHGPFEGPALDFRQEGDLIGARDHHRADAPVSLQDAEYHHFAAGSPPSGYAASTATKIAFVTFQLPRQRPGLRLGQRSHPSVGKP